MESYSQMVSVTAREFTIIGLIHDGVSDFEIGQKLNIKKRTIDHYLRMIYRKLQVNNRTKLIYNLLKEKYYFAIEEKKTQAKQAKQIETFQNGLSSRRVNDWQIIKFLGYKIHHDLEYSHKYTPGHQGLYFDCLCLRCKKRYDVPLVLLESGLSQCCRNCAAKASEVEV